VPASHTLVLRLAALTAAIPVILLRNLLDPRTTLLTLLFFLTPYLLIAWSPNSWSGFQVGFAIRLSISMQVALFAVLLMALGFPQPEPTPSGYRAALQRLNLALTLVAITTWIRARRRTNHLTAIAVLPVGLIYLFAAFFIEFGIAGRIYR
jgi:hypothetical protein